MTTMRRRVALLVLAATTLLAACGPGEEGTGIQPVTVNVGVLKGIDDESVTVNGVTYDRSQAVVVDGFDTALGGKGAALRLGMWVEVQGTVDASGESGVAQTIRVRPALRGVVEARGDGGRSVTVLDTTALIGNATVIDGTATAAELVQGDVIEVHGPLGGSTADMSASRVERLSHRTQVRPFELRGRVSQLDSVARTLTVGRRTVSYASATLTLRSALVAGMMVRVSAKAGPVAGKPWLVDRLTADQPLPDNLAFFYMEGFVSNLQTGPYFQIEGLRVDASNADNRGAVKAEGLRVAVLGTLVDGVVRAKSVSVVEQGEPVVFILSGQVTQFVPPASFRVRNVQVDASAAADVLAKNPAGLANGVQVKVRGTMLGRQLIVTRLEFLKPIPMERQPRD
jgi:Domain of unknown function (DUF5666)